jgi:tripartite-type tricarboxylate transporter receptor subunit TctC
MTHPIDRPLGTFQRRGIALAMSTCLWAGIAHAYPDRPVTLYVGFSAGGAADTVARALADEMSKTLGQRVIIENRVGASGNLATMAVLNAPADGHSLLFAAIHLATNPSLIGVKYDPAADLQMVSQVTSVPVLMLTSSQSALKAPADIVTASKRTNGGLKIGSGGVGTSSHLGAELFARSQGMPYLHVPYKGGPPANQALLGGEIDLMFDLMSGALKGFVDAGRVRPLAVMQETRITALPDVKSAKEWGLPASTHIRSWQGIALKSGTPAPVIEKIHAAVLAAANTPSVRARVWQLGSEVVTSKTPTDFQKHYSAELQRWSALVKAANIKAE